MQIFGWNSSNADPPSGLDTIDQGGSADNVSGQQGAGYGQDVNTSDYVGPAPVIDMNAEAASKPSKLVQFEAAAYRAISWLPFVRMTSALASTNQDVAGADASNQPINFSVDRYKRTISNIGTNLGSGGSKILGVVSSGLTKVVIIVVVVAILGLIIYSSAQGFGSRLADRATGGT